MAVTQSLSPKVVKLAREARRGGHAIGMCGGGEGGIGKLRGVNEVEVSLMSKLRQQQPRQGKGVPVSEEDAADLLPLSRGPITANEQKSGVVTWTVEQPLLPDRAIPPLVHHALRAFMALISEKISSRFFKKEKERR